jgi:hypothetical protein
MCRRANLDVFLGAFEPLFVPLDSVEQCFSVFAPVLLELTGGGSVAAWFRGRLDYRDQDKSGTQFIREFGRYVCRSPSRLRIIHSAHHDTLVHWLLSSLKPARTPVALRLNVVPAALEPTNRIGNLTPCRIGNADERD